VPEIPDKRLPGLVPGSSGRRIRDALHLHRHPGLVPGPNKKASELRFAPHRHPGLVPGPNKKASELRFAHSPSSRACPGNYSNRPRSKNNHRWMFLRSRISASHFPGRRMGISLGRFRDDGWWRITTNPSSRACPGN